MANDDLKQSVLANLRSVTQSCKGGVPFNKLQSDYKFLIGSPIPFKELGHSSLEAFIRSIPDVISLRKGYDGLIAEGVADASTAHIVNMVKKQKDSKKRVTRKPPPYVGMRKNVSYQYAARGGDSRSHYSSYPARSSRNSHTTSKYESSKRMASKSEITSSSYSKTKSYEQVPPRKGYEVPPRFSNLHRPKSPSPVKEPVSSPPTHVFDPLLSDSDSWDAIPASQFPKPQLSRPLPSKPRHIKNTQTVQLNSLEATKSAKEFIEVYCKMNNFKPEYKTKPIGQKSKTKGYVSTLCIGDVKYLLYPDSKSTVSAAEEEVAARAREKIKEQMQEQINSYSETPYGTAEDNKVLLGRIEEIVCEKPSGMFENGILKEYENKYNERLPSCWPELLKQSSFIEIDAVSLVNGRVPKGVNFIVRPTKELSSGTRTPSSTSSKTGVTNEDFDIGSLKKNLVDISYPKVPDIVLPDGNIWYVFVTNVVNSVSVRFIDYDDDFRDLSRKMSDFYRIRNLLPTEVLEHHMYAACDEVDPNVWHRVLVDSIEEDILCCYCVDVGEFLYVKRENLQEMNHSFLKLPFQAVHISLDGLEAFESCMELFEEKIYGQSLVAVVQRSKKCPDFFPYIPGIHRTIHTVTLYDTESEQGVDIDLNKLIMESLNESLVCQLPKLNTSFCGYLSHVTSNGHIYLRFRNPQNCLIERAMENLSPVFEEAAAITVEVPYNTMCAAKYRGGTWHRAIVSVNQNASSSSDLVEILFVDYGHTDSVRISQICELEPINSLLASFTYQALCCDMWDTLPSPASKWTNKACEKLLELAPFEQELIITVMSDDEENVPKVNLFKRDQDAIVSINLSLKCNDASLFGEHLDFVLEKTFSHMSVQSKKSLPENTLSNAIPDVAVPAEQIRFGSHSSHEPKWLNTPDDIKSPDAMNPFLTQLPLDLVSVPDNGFFDVYVTMSASPHNFYVQPFSSCTELNEMMEKMKECYTDEFASEYRNEMDIDVLRKNEFYAALHSDGSWYRVQINKIDPNNSVSVIAYYVDFGDFQSVNISNIQILYQKFRSLPCQAVRASLFGVKPLEQDWDPRHCFEFKNMITEKVFVSVVHKKVTEENDGIRNVFVELTLIDTSIPGKDNYIHELLVEKKMAKPV